MRFNKLIVGLALATLFAGAMAQNLESTSFYTFPSAIGVSNAGDTEVAFDHSLVMGDFQGSPLRTDGRFGNFALVFTINTRYVDMRFIDSNGDPHLLSSVTQNNFALTLNTWVSYTGAGTPAGTVGVLGGGVFKVSLLGAPGSALSNTSPLNTPFHSGDGSPIVLVVHGANLFADGMIEPTRYQVQNNEGTSTGTSFLRTQRTGDTIQRNYIVHMQGGQFSAVPEPASLIALGVGLAGMALRRRRSG